MSLTIYNNLMAMNAARNLGASYVRLGESTQRLSSGLRINNASDDAAGLAIRELMRAEIASLNQGVRNANDAISLIQTADGALAVIDEKLIRMKELAMQAATGTYSSDQRLIIDSEYQAMASEITRIANATKFNGVYLLNGNLSGDVHNGAGMRSTGKLKVHFGPSNNSAEDYYYIQIATATASALGLGSSSGGSSGGSSGMTEAEYLTQNGIPNTVVANNNYGLLFTIYPSYSNIPASVQNQFNSGDSFRMYQKGNDLYAIGPSRNGDIHVLRATSGVPGSYSSDVNISLSSGSTTSSSYSSSSISTQQLAQEALATLEKAIISKDNIRANLGALQNRLQNTITSLQTQAENLQAAESRISDADVALEMTRFVRNQILTQAAVAMLAQANSLPRMALQLISG